MFRKLGLTKNLESKIVTSYKKVGWKGDHKTKPKKSQQFLLFPGIFIVSAFFLNIAVLPSVREFPRILINFFLAYNISLSLVTKFALNNVKGLTVLKAYEIYRKITFYEQIFSSKYFKNEYWAGLE